MPPHLTQALRIDLATFSLILEAGLKDPMVKLQISFMRLVAGASKPAHRLLFAELSQLPLHYFVV